MTIKGYTTIEQSLKLVEILPLESADGFYPNRIDTEYQGVLPIECKHGTPLLSQEIPAWSLAALIDCLPHIQEFYPVIGKINGKFICRYKGSGIYTNGANPIDACVDMIESLHKLNLL